MTSVQQRFTPTEMTRSDDLRVVRRAYAKQIMAVSQVKDAWVEDAFATIPREAFLGRGPWPIYRFGGGYMPTPTNDPVYLYTNDLVGIVPERQLNNGQPSFHAYLLACGALQRGEHVVHVGAGVGYYTAIMGHIVGPSGRVTAIEFESDLAARAATNLLNHPNIDVIEGDGATVAFENADVIYVNAGATRPADNWLDRLNDGGRLILPLTTDNGFSAENSENIQRRGAVFVIKRRGNEFLARWVSGAAIYPCQGMRDEDSERALATAFEKGDWKRITRLRRTSDLPEEECWVKAPGWCLSYR